MNAAVANLKELRKILQNPDYTEHDVRRALELLQGQQQISVLFRCFDLDMPAIERAMSQKDFDELENCPFVQVVKVLTRRTDLTWRFLFTQLIFQQSSTGIILNFLPLIPDPEDQDVFFFDYIQNPAKHYHAVAFLMEKVISSKPEEARVGIATYLDFYAARRKILLLRQFSQEHLTPQGFDLWRNSSKSREEIDRARAVFLSLVEDYRRRFHTTQEGREMVARMPSLRGETSDLLRDYFSQLFS